MFICIFNQINSFVEHRDLLKKKKKKGCYSKLLTTNVSDNSHSLTSLWGSFSVRTYTMGAGGLAAGWRASQAGWAEQEEHES